MDEIWRTRRRAGALVLWGGMLALLSGCALSGPSAAAASATPLLGTAWRLSGVTPETRAARLQLLDGGRVAGNDGCNRLLGSYVLDGEKLSFGSLAGTRMACADHDPASAAMPAALARVTHWRVAGRVLELRAEGTVLLRFDAASP
jgi:heat shock protein HslJ